MNNEVLIVLGIQNDMETKYAGLQEIKNDLVEKFKDFLYEGGHIFIVKNKQWKGADVPYCQYGTPGFEIIREMDDAMKLATYEQMEVLTKPTYGSIDLIKRIKDLAFGSSQINRVTIMGGPESDIIANASLIRSNFKNVKVSVGLHYTTDETMEKSMENVLKSLDCEVERNDTQS